MDNISLTSLATLVGILGFLYTYIKDRYDSGKAIGKLEQRVTSLEKTSDILEQLTATLTDTRLAVVRLEQKVDGITAWIEKH